MTSAAMIATATTRPTVMNAEDEGLIDASAWLDAGERDCLSAASATKVASDATPSTSLILSPLLSVDVVSDATTSTSCTISVFGAVGYDDTGDAERADLT